MPVAVSGPRPDKRFSDVIVSIRPGRGRLCSREPDVHNLSVSSDTASRSRLTRVGEWSASARTQT